MKDKKDKKPKFKEKFDKPSSTMDFDALLPVIVDGQMVVTEKSTKLVFMRKRFDGDVYSFAHIHAIGPDRYVTIWDDTIGHRFIFNLNTDTKMSDHLRVYDKNAKKKAPSPELLEHLQEGIDDAKEGRTITYIPPDVMCELCEQTVPRENSDQHVCDLSKF